MIYLIYIIVIEMIEIKEKIEDIFFKMMLIVIVIFLSNLFKYYKSESPLSTIRFFNSKELLFTQKN